MKKITTILFVCSTLMLTTCKKFPELKVYDLKLTSENVEYSQTSAEIKVEYEYVTNLLYVNVTMSKSTDFDYSMVAQSEIIDSVFIANFVDLHTDDRYYYKLEYSNGINVVTSEVRNFYLNPAMVTLATVATKEVTNITGTSATCGGDITDDGGYSVTSRGVCWSTERHPTIFDTYTTDGTGTGSYTSTITGLEEETVYYVRAYAINEKGTSYGTEYEFTTVTGGGTIELPTITTAVASEITSASIVCGGDVIKAGNGAVTARGVCWSTNQNPTLSDEHTTDGTGTGTFTSSIQNLSNNTTYYVRSYATNSDGTAYGDQESFKTLPGGINGSTPVGAINGLFTINDKGDQVWFSQGNLQYKASTNSWKFAASQYEHVGNDNTNISSNYSNWIDLFGWGTSGYDHGAVMYQPYSSSTLTNVYNVYGLSKTYNLYNQTGMADWGYNSIANGGHAENQWRTLSIYEWDFVLNKRNTPSGIRFVKAVVNGKGLVILPDDWDTSIYSLNDVNTGNADYYSNVISTSNWANMENAGAVFIPLGGYRYGVDVSCVDDYGYYWSSSAENTNHAYCMYFGSSSVTLYESSYRYYGYSVRLVHDF